MSGVYASVVSGSWGAAAARAALFLTQFLILSL